MGLFKKTIKHSKPSSNINERIKNLDEELKVTGVISSDSTKNSTANKQVDNVPEIYDGLLEKVNDDLSSWREDLLEDIQYEEYSEEQVQRHQKNVVGVENIFPKIIESS